MADYFCKPDGIDSDTGGKSRATAVQHIWKACQLAGANGGGNRVVVMAGKHLAQKSPGTSGTATGITLPNRVEVVFEAGAWLDQNNEYEYGFVNASGGTSNSKITGATIYNCISNCISLRCIDTEVSYCDLRNTGGHAISINARSDNVYIHHNYCQDNDLTKNFRSGISCFGAENSGRPALTVEPGYPGRPGGGWGFIITDNVIVATGFTNASNGDGNSIIIDCFNDLNSSQVHSNEITNYNKHTFISRNILIGAAGCGLKVMLSYNVHAYRNTMALNKREEYNKTNNEKRAVWKSEYQNQFSGFNITRENIMYSNKISGAVCAIVKGSGNGLPFAVNGPKPYSFVDNNTWDRNLVFTTLTGERLIWGQGSNPAPTMPGVTARPGGGGYFTADPKFKGPVSLTPYPAQNIGADACRAVYLARFALDTGSPAIGASATAGKDIGAIQASAEPPPPETFTMTAPGVMTIGGSPIGGTTDNPTYPVGAPVTFTAAAYNSAPDSRSFIVQWYNGVIYETKAATITGPVSGTYTVVGGAPAVTAEGGLRIRETGVKAGFTSISTPTNWINIAPTPVSTDKLPVNTALPVIAPSTPVVGSACVVSDGSWDGDPAPTFGRQWKVNGVNIPGATGSSYVPTSSDFGKALTVAVTGTNSVGSATAVSAATYNVVNPTDVTLAEAVARLVAAEAEIAALRAADVAQAARDDNQDTALRGVETGLIARISATDLIVSATRDRVDTLADTVDANAASMDFLAETVTNLANHVDELEAVGRVRVSRRRTVVVLPVGTVNFGAVEVQLTSTGPGDPGTIKVKVAQVPDGIALGKLVIAGDAAPNAYTFTPAAGGWCAPFANLDASLSDPAKAWVEAINDDGAALAAAKLVDIQFVTI